MAENCAIEGGLCSCVHENRERFCERDIMFSRKIALEVRKDAVNKGFKVNGIQHGKVATRVEYFV